MTRHALVVTLLIFTISSSRVLAQDEEEPLEQAPVVNVDVYYESLCPDSQNFINRQLTPSYSGLKDYIHVNLIPFGKASWTEGEGRRPTQFSCQHGPPECQGNQAHSCALHEIAASYPDLQQQQQQKSVVVIGCVMASGGHAGKVANCARNNEIKKDVISRIETCRTSNFGRNLLVENGKKTFELEKPLKFVPTIVINGEKNSDAFNNFTKAVCDAIEGQKPSVCK